MVAQNREMYRTDFTVSVDAARTLARAGIEAIISNSRGPDSLNELVRELAVKGINADAVVRASEPAQAIVDVAAERDADLIVMASHQRHGLDAVRDAKQCLYISLVRAVQCRQCRA